MHDALLLHGVHSRQDTGVIQARAAHTVVFFFYWTNEKEKINEKNAGGELQTTLTCLAVTGT